MLPGWMILLSACGYILLLFAVASYGDRRVRKFGVPKIGRPAVYALSLGVCTSGPISAAWALPPTKDWNLPASISVPSWYSCC